MADRCLVAGDLDGLPVFYHEPALIGLGLSRRSGKAFLPGGTLQPG